MRLGVGRASEPCCVECIVGIRDNDEPQLNRQKRGKKNFFFQFLSQVYKEGALGE